MEMFIDPQVKSIASRSRKWVEGIAAGTKYENTLCGYCAISAAEMFRQLSKAGFKPKIHAWRDQLMGFSCHVFVVVDDHVVDVTATQFQDLRKVNVFIAHHREAEQWEWYQSNYIFNDVKELIRWQKDSGWPRHQTAKMK